MRGNMISSALFSIRAAHLRVFNVMRPSTISADGTVLGIRSAQCGDGAPQTQPSQMSKMPFSVHHRLTAANLRMRPCQVHRISSQASNISACRLHQALQSITSHDIPIPGNGQIPGSGERLQQALCRGRLVDRGG